jgi:hypothetical protein
MTGHIYGNIGLLQSRRRREWAKEDGIDENDSTLVRLANALDSLRRRYRAGETKKNMTPNKNRVERNIEPR